MQNSTKKFISKRSQVARINTEDDSLWNIIEEFFILNDGEKLYLDASWIGPLEKMVRIFEEKKPLFTNRDVGVYASEKALTDFLKMGDDGELFYTEDIQEGFFANARNVDYVKSLYPEYYDMLMEDMWQDMMTVIHVQP